MHTVQHFPSKIGLNMAVKHRAIVSKYLKVFDFFIYAEDDMRLTLRHIQHFLWENARLQGKWTPCFVRYDVFKGQKLQFENAWDNWQVSRGGDRGTRAKDLWEGGSGGWREGEGGQEGGG